MKKNIEFSKFNPEMYDRKGRIRVAKQILKVLQDHTDNLKLKKMRVLDMGCSTGFITNYLANYVKEIVGIDVDREGIEFAGRTFKKKNLKFVEMDAARTNFPSASFDLIICNQLYCAMSEPKSLMSEVYRLLKNKGICFFGALNKYIFWENQYKLPFLAFLPSKLAKIYLKFSSRPEIFNLSYKSYWELKSLCHKFIIHKFTPKLLNDPQKYGFEKLSTYQNLLGFIPVPLWDVFEPIVPNFIWILEKR